MTQDEPFFTGGKLTSTDQQRMVSARVQNAVEKIWEAAIVQDWDQVRENLALFPSNYRGAIFQQECQNLADRGYTRQALAMCHVFDRSPYAHHQGNNLLAAAVKHGDRETQAELLADLPTKKRVRYLYPAFKAAIDNSDIDTCRQLHAVHAEEFPHITVPSGEQALIFLASERPEAEIHSFFLAHDEWAQHPRFLARLFSNWASLHWPNDIEQRRQNRYAFLQAALNNGCRVDVYAPDDHDSPVAYCARAFPRDPAMPLVDLLIAGVPARVEHTVNGSEKIVPCIQAFDAIVSQHSAPDTMRAINAISSEQARYKILQYYALLQAAGTTP